MSIILLTKAANVPNPPPPAPPASPSSINPLYITKDTVSGVLKRVQGSSRKVRS